MGRPDRGLFRSKSGGVEIRHLYGGFYFSRFFGALLFVFSVANVSMNLSRSLSSLKIDCPLLPRAIT